MNHASSNDREIDLIFDVPGEVVHVVDAHAAGVDELEEAVVVTHEMGQAIARDTGLVVDDGDAHAGEPVEHAAFADVGPADDDYLRYAHSSTTIAEPHDQFNLSAQQRIAL